MSVEEYYMIIVTEKGVDGSISKLHIQIDTIATCWIQKY